jgi:hypothetical protein
VFVTRGDDRVGMEINECGENGSTMAVGLIAAAFDFRCRRRAMRPVRFGSGERDPVNARVDLGAA